MYELTSYNIINELDKNHLLIFNSLSRAVIKISKNKLQECLENPGFQGDIGEYLLKGFFIYKHGSDEKSLFSYIYKNLNTETRRIGVTLVPSRLCNLRCTYCIQNNLFNNHDSHFMTEKIIDNYYTWLLEYIQKFKTEEIGFNFYGGEPLMINKSILLYLIKKMNSLPVKTKFIMVTNGMRLLDHPDIIPYIDSYRITIDGLSALHDSRRVCPDGSGSYRKIVANINKYIKKYGKKNISIRMNVDKDNRLYLKEAVDQILSNIESSDIEFRLFPVVPNKKNVNFKSLHEDLVATANQMYDCYLHLKRKYNIKPFIFSMNCGISSFGRWVFDTDGSLHKCCSHIGFDEKKVGSLTSKLFNENYYDYLNREYDLECQECAYINYCGGGCKWQEEMHGEKQCLKEFYDSYIPRMIKLIYADC
ncbi:radical SAM/SPASM domain-containing protein [Breznakia pachnodae]|uniref:Radical SAM protein with 4Fe4S-binding SPASM domain n=1 Tax=Breznakia pachnodae TaxID=265178 RepID=A0ABU0E3S9_9FIRM|nr:SPASM domain-containing protein [Breznakia pachnodae]MDQ0361540.1 radical SAM protein with 4Fe4S-binding SPASM domain [Breznakia pachnodae]